MSEITDVTIMLRGFAEDVRKEFAPTNRHAQLNFERRELLNRAANEILDFRAEVERLTTERDRYKAALEQVADARHWIDCINLAKDALAEAVRG